MNALEPILAATREAVARRRERVRIGQLERAAVERTERKSFATALRAPGLSLIAEHKRRSPSAGPIREDLALEDVTRAYARGGAAALSILTEAASFGGSLDDLAAARRTADLPILRKDFIVDPYQVVESAAAGADAILLIVAALEDEHLISLHAQATDLGLDVLVEVHDGRELDRAIQAVAPPILGINNRDLTTLQVDTRRTFELRPLIPEHTTVVAESGFSRPEQMDELEAAGIDAVLIGEALMRAHDVELQTRALTARAQVL